MKNNQKSFLKEENLLTLLSQNNFIIPEIQREYVWGNNEKVITKFLKELKTKIGNSCECCNLPSENSRINIGFLYSYKPEYVKVQNDRFLDENLIDGQQRFTTLFLLTFFFALKEGRKNDFLSLIRFDTISMSFDFKVRDLTKRFLLEFIEKTNNLDEITSVEKQTWFLKDYKTDISINAIIKSLRHIQEVFNCETRYYNHILTNVVFWHFKTEVTSEGEELYITMNARGEDLAENEITKAALMIEGEDLLSSGKLWEDWQQFFWKNRDKNRNIQSADFGYNSFINCIAGLENYLKLNGDSFKIFDFENLLTLEIVKKYINGFEYILNNYKAFKSKYIYSNWVDECLKDIWSIFNNNETDWFADYTDQNKGTEQNRMVFIWSWLLFLKSKKEEELNVDETFRIVRFFYIRYKNFNRAVNALKQTVEIIEKNGIFDTVGQDSESSNTEEEHKTNNSYRTINEKLKYNFLNNLKTNMSSDILEYESLIWEIEDHPLNIEGYGLKNINSSHLINFEKLQNIEELRLIKTKFYELFPSNDYRKINYSNINKIRTILFWYGAYWQKQWASYYWKYNFGEWKRIIRDSDSDNSAFSLFFNEFKNIISLDELLLSKITEPKYEEETNDELSIFKWYSFQLKEAMWRQGQYLAIGHYNYPNIDKYFFNIREIVNIKGNFNGGSPEVLSQLLNNK